MARKSKSEQLKEIHVNALKRLDDAWLPQAEARELSLRDRKIAEIPESIWEGAIGEQYKNKPTLTMSIIPRELRRLINQQLSNRITTSFIPKSGDKEDGLTDALNGVFRADSLDSHSQEAIDNAFREGVCGGMGGWRLSNVLIDEMDPENDHQRIIFEPIYEADSTLFFDPNAKLYDKSDAKYAFLLTSMTVEAFEDAYPDMDVADIGRNVGNYGCRFPWGSVDTIYVAEYFVVEEVRDMVVTFKAIDGSEEKHRSLDLSDDDYAMMEAKGTVEVSRRPVRSRRVHKYLVTGAGIEDLGHIAGTEIPLVPYYAERTFINGIEVFKGFVRCVKDAVRLKSMMISGLALQAATGGNDKPYFYPEQLAGHEKMHANDAVDNNAFLLINPATHSDGATPAVGPLGIKQASQIPPAMAALIQQSTVDVDDMLGNQDQGDEYSANLSGHAVELVQGRLDGLSFLYMDNLARSVRHAGKVYSSMVGDVYVETDRKIKIVGESEEVDVLDMGKVTLQDGVAAPEVDFSRASVDVVSDVGPESSSKRSATIKALTTVMGFVEDPMDRKILTSTIVRNLEGEGLGPIREHFRKQLVQMDVLDPTEEDKEAMAAAQANAKPDPQAQLAASLAQEASSKVALNEAKTAETQTNSQLNVAKAAETLAGIDRDDQAQALAAAQALYAAQQPQNPPQEGETTAGTAPLPI